ncbi:hypothetical protein FA13DRAFT_1711301 [Coprinellus micaceus]|uniref:Uncharacterized protein n=1 Tax=Coprinellus micaceus TaxID=71717 RepID=A0A4Y7T5B2_COPMI|nr:hypothetical protein FA13DRAFT_1711301 [Coprinellus micaceus]
MPPDDIASEVDVEEEFNASFCEEEEEDYYQLMKESHEADLSRFMEEWTANKKAEKEEASRSWREYRELWEAEKRWWKEAEEERKFIDRLYSKDRQNRDSEDGWESDDSEDAEIV